MNNTLTDKKKISLKAKLDKLKKTAQHIDEVAEFFKNNPRLIPGVPTEHLNKLEVYANSQDITFDRENLTFNDVYTFTFEILEIEDTDENNTFTEITGLSLGEKSGSDQYFRVEYDLSFSAVEWRFVAADVLCDLDQQDIEVEDDHAVYSNILQAHFPHQKWDTFLALWGAGLIPDNAEELVQFLQRPIASKDIPSVPNDFNL